MPPLLVVDLGTMPYGAALELQRAVARERVEGRLEDDVLLLVEHPPVVTLGRAARDDRHVLASHELLSARGVELFEVERGGDVTFHGPGQLVGYPIFDLAGHRKDLHWYLRQLEEALIRTLETFGVPAERHPDYTGVWTHGVGASTLSARSGRGEPLQGQRLRAASDIPATEPRKIASIGVHARNWVTWHGFALNVNTDLSFFDLIVPCGIPAVRMTSMAAELEAGEVVTADVAERAASAFGDVFRRSPELLPVETLISLLGERHPALP